MPIPCPNKKSFTYIIYPFICVNLCTGETEATLATKRNLLYLTTPKTPVSYKSILWISTSQHLFNHSIIILCLVFWINLLKLSPMVYEYLLEYILALIQTHANIISKLSPEYKHLSIEDLMLMRFKKGNSYAFKSEQDVLLRVFLKRKKDP